MPWTKEQRAAHMREKRASDKARAGTHDACDARIAELEAENAKLRARHSELRSAHEDLPLVSTDDLEALLG